MPKAIVFTWHKIELDKEDSSIHAKNCTKVAMNINAVPVAQVHLLSQRAQQHNNAKLSLARKIIAHMQNLHRGGAGCHSSASSQSSCAVKMHPAALQCQGSSC